MGLYLVRNPAGLPVWVCYEDDEMRVWSYVHNTGRFHLNDGLAEDFYIDQSNSYEPIDVDIAKRYIAGGLATLSPHKHGHLIRKFDADRSARPVADVLADATPGPSL